MSTREERQRRRFSEGVKRDSVVRIDKGEISRIGLSRELEVSTTTVYKWLEKYSVTYIKSHRIIVEKKSTGSKVKELERQLKELEAALGRKQLQIDYLEKLIEISEASEGIEIRKKGDMRRLNGSEGTEDRIRGG